MAAKKTIKIPGFGLGLLVGAFVTAMYFKKKYDCITIHIDESKNSEACPDFVERDIVEGEIHHQPEPCNCKKDCGETDAVCEECECSDCQSDSCENCSVK